MAYTFNAEEFLERIDAGAFDGGLGDALRKLSREQVERLALLMAKRIAGEAIGASPWSQRNTLGID